MEHIIHSPKPFDGVAKGSTATIDLPIGPCYHMLLLECTATGDTSDTVTLAKLIDTITLKVNGKPQRIMKASELDAINTQYGANYASNAYASPAGVDAFSAIQAAAQGRVYLPIYLAEPWRKSYAARNAFAWKTAWEDGTTLRSFQVEVSLLDHADILSAGLALKLIADTTNEVGKVTNSVPEDFIVRWDRSTYGYVQGENHFDKFYLGDALMEIDTFMPESDTITQIEVRKDNKVLRAHTNAQNNQILIENDFNEAGLAITRFPIVADHTDQPMDAWNLNGVKDFRVVATVGVASATSKLVSVISQYYGRYR